MDRIKSLAKTCVVNQHIHLLPSAWKVAEGREYFIRIAYIKGEKVGVDPIRTHQLVRKLREAIDTSGCQQKIISLPGKHRSTCRADTRTGTCNESFFLRHEMLCFYPKNKLT